MRFENSKNGLPMTTIREITVLLESKHQNIVNLIEIVTDKHSNIYLVMEYCENDLISVQRTFNESEVRN